MSTKFEELSARAVSQHLEAQTHLDEIEAALKRLADAGMYDAVPTESWESRNGSEQVYLVMVFPIAPNGEHYGPGGKRRLYVGKDPANIAHARAIARNRERYETLKRDADRLARELQYDLDTLDRLVTRTGLHTHVKSLNEVFSPTLLYPIDRSAHERRLNEVKV